ncbi:hypothetical protein DL764_001441 [Monosporascus ibericus]|uniref:C2H2-type domain-containing protein n=1 Tax=Monosporascus ibericus TaxID=155417 RepID=A0A4Q4TUA3_9PEZI|nr:hypothetical protein DL764_001441 [Monosporascus ibericus]
MTYTRSVPLSLAKAFCNILHRANRKASTSTSTSANHKPPPTTPSFKHVLLAKMSDYLQYFDFDAYMADTPVEAFDFAFLNEEPSAAHGGYDPNPSLSDLPGANVGGIDSKDHLVQHLEHYHKLDLEEIEKACPKWKRQRENDFLVCPRQGCDAHRDDAFRSLPWSQQVQSKPFKSRGDYGKHMKEVHKETPFPCTVAECDRVGAKGYMREKDLIKHLSNKHPEAPQYEAETRETRRSERA